MAVSKKDFEAIASVIAGEFSVQGNNPSAQIAVRAIAFGVADKFAQANPRSDREVFYKACGIRS